MSSTQAIRMGQAFVELFANRKPLQNDLQKAKKDIQAWSSSLLTGGTALIAAGVGILAPLTAATRLFEQTGSQLDDMSQRIGVAADKLSELGYAASREGASLEDLEAGLGKMQVFLHGAAHGSTEAAATLKDLGLSFADLAGLPPEQQLLRFADALAKVGNAGERTTLVRAVFGKGGSQLLPLLQQGAGAINQITAEARRLGVVMSAEDAAAAAELGDSFARLWATMKGMAITIGGALAPAFQLVSELFAAVSKPIREWISENKALVVSLAGIGIALVVVGTGMVGTALGIQGVVLACGVLSAAIATTFSIVASIAGILASPIVLAGILITALVGGFLYFSGVGSRIIKSFGAAFSSLTGTISTTVEGISSALASGDIDGAMKILWAGLQVIWLQGLFGLKSAWRGFTNYLLDSIEAPFIAIGEELTLFVEEAKQKLLGIKPEAKSKPHKKEPPKTFAELNKQAREHTQGKKQPTEIKAAPVKKALQGEVVLTPQNSRQTGRQTARQKAAEMEYRFEQKLIESAKAGLQAAVDSVKPAKTPGRHQDPLNGLQTQDSIKEKKTGSEKTVGTFNALAAGRLAGQGTQAAIAANTAKTAKAVKEVKAAVEQIKPVMIS